MKVSKLTKIAKILFILVASGFFFNICYNNFVADINYEAAQGDVDNSDLLTAMDHAQNAINLNPMEPNYYRMRARVFINYLPTKEEKEKKVIKELIIKDLVTAYTLNPHNLVTIRNIVPLYYFVAAENILIPGAEQNVDPEFLPYAKNFYTSVKNISPNDAGVYALLAKYEKRLGLMSDYDFDVEKVRELRPDLLDWYESFK